MGPSYGPRSAAASAISEKRLSLSIDPTERTSLAGIDYSYLSTTSIHHDSSHLTTNLHADLYCTPPPTASRPLQLHPSPLRRPQSYPPTMMRTSASSLLRAGARATTMRTSTAVVSRAATTHAISNPTLANIEKRWEGMPPTEQAEIWMSLRDRMKENWAELTLQEKKAAYWIAFGAHGPRAQPPADEGRKVAMYTALGVLASLTIFTTLRLFAGPAPHTMNREYEEETNELLIKQRAEPLTGISSEGYSGKGQVQSPPKH
ncbi:cytochrome c oxidase subunit IV-domain-containing protein [Astrocystis sublimbata]|nr:cytochrome c oxidase subunit IV-domain-containing protein [Astrocystis sublimbata]